MDTSSGASIYFVIKGLPVAHSEIWARWASNTSVQFKLSENAAGIVLIVERKRASTAKQLKKAVKELCARCGCKLPELGDDWVEALDNANEFQAALQPAANTEGGSQPSPEPQTMRTCAMEALEGAETVFSLPPDFDRRSREKFMELQMRA